MQTKKLNSYKITYKNGEVKNINASCMIEALASEGKKPFPAIQVFMTQEEVDTAIGCLPDEIIFTSVVADNGGGSIATPASGKVHAGDTLAFRAIPDKGYNFVSWSRDGTILSTEESFVYEMETLHEGETSAVFTATFKKSPVSWTSTVSPEEATGEGCVAFPAGGVTEDGENVSLIAVAKGSYTFVRWERNGVELGTNEILETTASQLEDGEESVVYTAVFTEAP